MLGKSRGSKRKSIVPNLSSRTRSQAQTDLANVGLSYTESTETTGNSSLNLNISSQSISAGETILYGSSVPFVYYNYVDPTVYTYGPCQSYDSNVSYACVGGTQNQATTITYRRRQILANGTWNGSYEECTSTSSTTGSQYTDGVCGYTAPPPCSISSYSGWSYSSITWSGNCVSSSESGTATARSRTDNCGNTYNESGSYAVSRSCTPPAVTWYCTSNYVNGGGGQFTWDSNITGSACGDYAYSCSTSGYPATPTIPNCCSGLNGLPCGYNNTGTYNCAGTCVGASSPPASCVCNYSDQGSYHYAPECCPSGSQRSGSLGGTTVNACCPNVSKTAKFVCKSYDVTNSASNNYYTCYYTGECAANNNSDNSRAVCYV